ncbi:MAG TPA: hypothetical protein VFL98_02810 [Candidatus Paceibacterota bacterium]|nr:hypothetical protein [Candidatus Paceibacterota bacterium]
MRYRTTVAEVHTRPSGIAFACFADGGGFRVPPKAGADVRPGDLVQIEPMPGDASRVLVRASRDGCEILAHPLLIGPTTAGHHELRLA